MGMLGCLAMKDGLPEVTIQCANIVVIVSNELTETDADLEQELLADAAGYGSYGC